MLEIASACVIGALVRRAPPRAHMCPHVPARAHTYTCPILPLPTRRAVCAAPRDHKCPHRLVASATSAASAPSRSWGAARTLT
eukprot:1647681-Prymnesium_polylepis.1